MPDTSLIHALQLAALRGVDVRIMLPQKPDHKLVYLAAFSYIAEAEPSGVKFYRFLPGFMHHKVILVDDDLAAVGTANFDNRSVRLNFEIMLLFANRSFARAVSDMLESDFTVCRQVRRGGFRRAIVLVPFRRAAGTTHGTGSVRDRQARRVNKSGASGPSRRRSYRPPRSGPRLRGYPIARLC